MPEQHDESQLYDDLVSSKPPVQQRGLFGSGKKDKQKSLTEEAAGEPSPVNAALPRDGQSVGAGERAAPAASVAHTSAPKTSPATHAGYAGHSTHRYADGTTAKRKTILLRPDQDLSLKRYCAERDGESISSVIQRLLDDAGFYGGKIPGRIP